MTKENIDRRTRISDKRGSLRQPKAAKGLCINVLLESSTLRGSTLAI